MNESLTKQLHVLVLGKGFGAGDLAHWLGNRASLEQVDHFDEAIRALEDHAVDLVVSSAEKLVAFRDFHLARQDENAAELATHSVAVFNAQGDAVWTSDKYADLDGNLKNRIQTHCAQTLDHAQKSQPDADVSSRLHRLGLTTDSGEFYEVTATPIADVNHCITAVAAVVRDTTSSRRLQDKLDAIDRAGRELVRIDAEQITRLNVHERLALIEQKVIRYTGELLNFDHIAVFVLDHKSNKLELALASGMPSEVKAIDLYASDAGSGICGYVAAHGHSYLCPDVRNDPNYLPGLHRALSSLTVPLRLNDQIVGILNVESEHLSAFKEEDRQFAEILGRHIAIALHILELLVSERHTTTGQLGKDVKLKIAGPLNDVLTEIETLKEDFIGMDELRNRLTTLSENVLKIRKSIAQVTSVQPGIIAPKSRRVARFDPILKDKHVLIVDDEEMIRETVQDVLSGYGCEVVIAETGDEALQRIADQPFDLVLSDIKLPSKNGYEIFAASKAANPQTPVILMTGFGYDPNHAVVRANREGLAAVLFKPFKVDQLLGEIRTALKSTAANEA